MSKIRILGGRSVSELSANELDHAEETVRHARNLAANHLGEWATDGYDEDLEEIELERMKRAAA